LNKKKKMADHGNGEAGSAEDRTATLSQRLDVIESNITNLGIASIQLLEMLCSIQRQLSSGGTVALNEVREGSAITRVKVGNISDLFNSRKVYHARSKQYVNHFHLFSYQTGSSRTRTATVTNLPFSVLYQSLPN
jgi:hypothetical protein